MCEISRFFSFSIEKVPRATACYYKLGIHILLLIYIYYQEYDLQTKGSLHSQTLPKKSFQLQLLSFQLWANTSFLQIQEYLSAKAWPKPRL